MTQPDLFAALSDRDAAMAAVSDHADAQTPGFSELAADYILAHLRQCGPATAEALTDACRAAGIVPHDDRAFGPVIMRLARGGLICKVGQAARRKGHGCSGGNIWQANEGATP